ncbi:MAG: hypothetical protein JXB29_02205 [Sedimentisphaerales bacterium]|nr:hypothetical protein [Sedimentisphaerales bacterium]
MSFESKWGRFEEEGMCYAIENPNTPRPWENYLYSRDGKFHVMLTQRAKGRAYYISPEANTVSHGRNYCLRDMDSGQCWSLNAGDAPVKPKSYRCEHRPGRSVFTVRHKGIVSQLTVAVAPDQHVEVNQLQLENTTDKKRRFSLIGYYDVDLQGIHNNNQLEKSRFIEDIGAVLVRRCYFATVRYKYAGFYVSDRKPNSFCGDLESLFDADVPRSEAQLWNRGTLANVNAHATRLVQALQHDIVLDAGEELTINYGFGLAEDLEEAETLARSVLAEGQFENMLRSNERFFEQLIGDCPIKTEDTILNYFLNIWSKVQLHRQVICGRAGSGNNWRNNMLDSWGWLPFDSHWARYYIEQLCSIAKPDGFLPNASVRVPKAFTADYAAFWLKARQNDTAAWAGIVAGHYAAETGDLEFFRKKVRYAEGTRQATIAECLINGIRWVTEHTGPHGMILMLDGDWCDPLNEVGKSGIGQSPWTSVALIVAIKYFNPLLIRLGYENVAEQFQKTAQSLAKVVNEHAWDGKWYIRGITDKGIRFCTADDPDANVSLMMQAWPIISGIVPKERLPLVLKAIDEHLKTDDSTILYGPPFLKGRPELGRVTFKQPGTAENGSHYAHAATMLATAEIAAGRPDEALKIIKQVLPLREPDCTSKTTAIPLWLPNFWHGPHSTRPGLTSSIISTGSLATLYIDVLEGFFGIHQTLDGLEIKPCFPSCWNHAFVQRKWRGSTYNFEYVRDSGLTGITIELDDKKPDQNIIPAPTKAQSHQVKVYIGD